VSTGKDQRINGQISLPYPTLSDRIPVWIQAMEGGDNPIVSFFIGNGAFIMEQRMMNGIKAHAEGWVEPPYQEAVESVLWLIALLAGLAGAVLFITRRACRTLDDRHRCSRRRAHFTFSQPPVASGAA
jgi:hypothetical protein